MKDMQYYDELPWDIRIERDLQRDGTLRFSELRKEIEGISHKMLTQNLRMLERNGLVERTVHPTVPPRVEYTLTPLGARVAERLRGLADGGRIVCVADAFDAMTSDRPYRLALTHEEAVAEVERCAGTQFDPEIARVFLDLFARTELSAVS